jgi:branched-subunit amino acid transport protein
MTIWISVLVVGALSLAFRVLPVLAVARNGVGPRTADALRHAGAGAIAALIVLAVLRPTTGSHIHGTALFAVGVGGLLAWRGHSMLTVVLAGGGSYAVATALAAIL